MTESIIALLASASAVPRACRGPWSAAHQAATRTITRSLTHGPVAGRRHGQVFVGTPLAEVLNALRPPVHQGGAEPRVHRRCRWWTQVPRRSAHFPRTGL